MRFFIFLDVKLAAGNDLSYWITFETLRAEFHRISLSHSATSIGIFSS